MCLHRRSLRTHTHTHAPRGETDRPWEREIFFTTVEHRRLYPARRLNAALCLPERRELRLPSVNMSARIFHSRRRHASFAPLSRARYIADTFTPVASHKVCLPRAFALFPFLQNSALVPRAGPSLIRRDNPGQGSI